MPTSRLGLVTRFHRCPYHTTGVIQLAQRKSVLGKFRDGVFRHCWLKRWNLCNVIFRNSSATTEPEAPEKKKKRERFASEGVPTISLCFLKFLKPDPKAIQFCWEVANIAVWGSLHSCHACNKKGHDGAWECQHQCMANTRASVLTSWTSVWQNTSMGVNELP